MNIWNYQNLSNQVPESYRLGRDIDTTDLEYITIDNKEISIKREDLNPNKSFKDRSLSFQLSIYLSQGKKNFVISSSGNAAVSAAAYLEYTDATLDIFVSENIPEEKLERIEKYESHRIQIHKSSKAKSDAIKYVRQNGSTNLRGSIDNHAIDGFKTIAYELIEQETKIDAIFIPCSSGTSTVGIYEGYKDRGLNPPQIHIVQTTKIHTIAKEFDNDFEKSETSLSNCVSDRVAKRKQSILEIIEKTNGSGWVVSDKYIEKALQMDVNENTSPNSHLALAGYIKSQDKGYKFQKPCLIFSGL